MLQRYVTARPDDRHRTSPYSRHADVRPCQSRVNMHASYVSVQPLYIATTNTLLKRVSKVLSITMNGHYSQLTYQLRGTLRAMEMLACQSCRQAYHLYARRMQGGCKEDDLSEAKCWSRRLQGKSFFIFRKDQAMCSSQGKVQGIWFFCRKYICWFFTTYTCFQLTTSPEPENLLRL